MHWNTFSEIKVLKQPSEKLELLRMNHKNEAKK
jgi:hypothetical protein